MGMGDGRQWEMDGVMENPLLPWRSYSCTNNAGKEREEEGWRWEMGDGDGDGDGIWRWGWRWRSEMEIAKATCTKQKRELERDAHRRLHGANQMGHAWSS